MCIIFLNTAPAHNLKLVMAFNRDEDIGRPTAPAHFWETQKLYGGKDISPMGVVDGTWLGVSKKGKFSALMNVINERSGIVFSSDRSTRGGIVTDYLTAEQSPQQYVDKLRGDGKQYNYFNLVMGQFRDNKVDLYLYEYYHDKLISLPHGISSVGNLPLSQTNTRAEHGLNLFSEINNTFKVQEFETDLSRNNYLTNQLFDMLSDTCKIPHDVELTGAFDHIFNKGYIFKTAKCATVSSTVLLVDKDDNCLFIERTNSGSEANALREFQWQITA